MAKTVVIWDLCGEERVTFYVCEGDLRHLNGVYVNADGSPEDEDAINDAVSKGHKLTDFPLEVVKDPEEEVVAVIAAGIIP